MTFWGRHLGHFLGEVIFIFLLQEKIEIFFEHTSELIYLIKD